MSADLFAAFEAPVQAVQAPASKQSQPQGTASSASPFPTSTADPFSFFQPSTVPSRTVASPQVTQWPSLSPQQPAGDAGNIWGGLTGPSRLVPSPQVADEDDDGWGDFETPAQSVAPKPAPISLPSQPRPTTRIVRAPTIDLMTNNLLSLGSSPERPKKLDGIAQSPSWQSPVQPNTDSRPKNTDPNVLFDADDFDGEAPPNEDDEDDDFGDFEAPAPAPVPAPARAQPPLDLLLADFAPQSTQPRLAPPSQLLSTLSLNDSALAYPQAPKSPSFQERNPFPGLGLKTPVAEEFPQAVKARSPSPVTAWPTFESQDELKTAAEENSFEAEWGAFDDRPPKAALQPQSPKSKPKPKPLKTTTTNTVSSTKPTTKPADPNPDWDWDVWDGGNPSDTPQPSSSSSSSQPTAPQPQTGTKPASPTGPPPTNIPPPSILLSIFPSLLSAATTSLLQPLSSAPASARDRTYGSPATIRFLRGYLALARVAARVAAGRRLRWHRDRFLAQGMSISAAGSGGGKGGMKLAGIDNKKVRAAREDREAADVEAAWTEVAGRLRGAVAAANAAAAKGGLGLGEGPLRVPELRAEGMRVETLRGALTAPRACVVCGLKREERVVGVDVEVEDGLGEWWVEFWGHRECRNFWVEHEAALRSR